MAEQESFWQRRGHSVVSAAAALAIVVLVALLYLGGHLNWMLGRSEAAPKPDLTRPFAGTPAGAWADGAKGIVLPEPRAVGRYSADQVAAATEQVKKLITAARLDRKVIEARERSAAVSLLAPNQQLAAIAELAPERQANTGHLVTTIGPGVRLLPAEPKVTGRMQVTTQPDESLVVVADYLFGYAFEPGSQEVGNVSELIAVQRWRVHYLFRGGAQWTQAERGIWVGEATGYQVWADCALAAKGLLAPSGKSGKDADVRRWFDPEHKLEPNSGPCAIAKTPPQEPR